MLESCDCSAAFCARSFTRSAFVESSARFSRSTATFTNTTPARRIPLTAIQRMPPRARARFLARDLARTWRGRTTGSATAAGWACATLANLRRDPEACRLGARIALRPRARTGGSHASASPATLAPAADTDREVRRARAAVLLGAEELLDDPVLERVERDHAEPPAGTEQLECRGQGTLERAELVVHLDAERLEDAFGRVPLAEPGRAPGSRP